MMVNRLGLRGFVTAVLLTVGIFLALTGLGSTATASSLVAAAGDDVGLFTTSTRRTPAQSLEPTSVRARLVEINFAALGKVGAAQSLALNFFDDVVLTAVRDRVEQNRSGSYTWVGFFETDAGPGQAILVVRDDIVVGHINSPRGEYVIRPAIGKTHLVFEVDPAAVLSTKHYDIIPGLSLPMPATGIPAMAPTASDDGSVIDVLVVYTDDAVTAQGVPTLESLIDLYMAYTNQAYINSNISQRVDLVYTGEVTYNEPLNNGTSVSQFRNTSDGNIDIVHTLRNTYHADLNYLLVQDDGSPGSCGGIAYVQTVVNQAWQSNGFSVQEACSYGSGVFAHELGHNMGSNHDWYVDSPTTNPYSYAHGYVDTTNRFRTIMSYSNHCGALGISCTALPNFANPNVLYNGHPTGVADGTSTSCTQNNTANPPCDADNQKTFANTDGNTAGFRQSQITWLGNNANWNDASNWTINEGAYNALTAVNRVPRTIDDVFIPTAPSGGNFPTISSGTLDARNVTLATGATLNMSGGTLNVYGLWEEQGTGAFNGSGGTVVFQGKLISQTVTANAISTFPNVQIGNGGSTKVNLGSNVDIDGNLTISSGATLDAGNHTIAIAGDWIDNSFNGFIGATSHVIFDGVTQTVSKTITTQTISAEDFDPEGSGNCANNLPSGWSQANNGSGFGWATGEYDNCFSRGPNTGPYAIRWWDTPDAWIFTNSFAFVPDIEYELEFKYANDNGSTSHFDARLASNADIVSMLAGSIIVNDVSSTVATYQTVTVPFTVSSAGTYYIGIRGYRLSGSNYGFIDDVTVRGTKTQTFYNVTFANSTATSFANNVAFGGDVTVNADATADLGSNDATVEGTVTNNGTLKQTRNISDGSGGTSYEFLTLRNAAASSINYYGVQITPDGGQALGETAVSISGNQNCTSNSSDPLLRRCYDITPTNAQSATIKYWYSSGELNGQTANDLKLWDWHSNAWTELAAGTDTYGTGCGTSAGCWGQWTGVATFSPMVLGSTSLPTGSPAGTCSAPTAPTSMTLNTTGTQLSWSGGTADSYQVWRSTNLPYFTPGANCASPGGLTCTANATAPLTTSSSTVGNNYFYKVVAVNTCGSTTAATAHVGDFSFALTPGSP